MKVAVFSTKSYDQQFLVSANLPSEGPGNAPPGHIAVGGVASAHTPQRDRPAHELTFFEPRLTIQTCRLADGFPAICPFVNDQLDAQVLLTLSKQDTRLIALRCSGFNHVDLRAAEQLGLTVTRVPAYSPQAVAEHTVGLILALHRRLHKAYNRVREGNFALEGLLGVDLCGQTVGVIGTGKIGTIVARILAGFGCRLLGYDVVQNSQMEALGARYVDPDELFANSDVVTLHCPLVPATHHLINEEALARMKRGVTLVNTSRGALIDTQAAVRALKSGKIGSLGLDVYEEEADLFFEDLSTKVIQDDVFARMLTFPNVIITGHQAFFTHKAMEAIARETLENITAFEQGQTPPGLITAESVRG